MPQRFDKRGRRRKSWRSHEPPNRTPMQDLKRDSAPPSTEHATDMALQRGDYRTANSVSRYSDGGRTYGFGTEGWPESKRGGGQTRKTGSGRQ
jgi:hypothetical protein